MIAREWLARHGYRDVVNLIDSKRRRWAKTGNGTRRNWWAVLAGDRYGNPRVVGETAFPVLAVAQLHEGVPVTPNARPHTDRSVPPPKIYRGRSARRGWRGAP
jgi:hypothetical protein